MAGSKNPKGNGGQPSRPSKAPGVIFRRFRKLRNGKVLDAHDYGYQAWPIPVRR